MTKIFITAILAFFALSACDVALSADPAREAAETVVRPIVAETVPGPAGVVLSDCIIDNATGAELANLAGAALTGVETNTIALVSSILQRPQTVACATSALAG